MKIHRGTGIFLFFCFWGFILGLTGIRGGLSFTTLPLLRCFVVCGFAVCTTGVRWGFLPLVGPRGQHSFTATPLYSFVKRFWLFGGVN